MLRIIFLLLFSSFAYAEYEFEKSKFKPGKVCSGMIGVWYTDVYANKTLRHITQINRKDDGTAYLKGLTLDYKSNEVSTWEFPSKWSCSDNWYVEKNEWGYTAFKIKNIANVNLLVDSQKNLNDSQIDIIESKGLLESSAYINQYFGIK